MLLQLARYGKWLKFFFTHQFPLWTFFPCHGIFALTLSMSLVCCILLLSFFNLTRKNLHLYHLFTCCMYVLGFIETKFSWNQQHYYFGGYACIDIVEIPQESIKRFIFLCVFCFACINLTHDYAFVLHVNW